MRDKQIEEMAKDVCVNCTSEICASGRCAYQCDCPLSIETIKRLHRKGYRKASDVAREIFEEIKKLISSECLVIKDENGIRGYVDASVHYILAELKKKYESEEK